MLSRKSFQTLLRLASCPITVRSFCLQHERHDLIQLVKNHNKRDSSLSIHGIAPHPWLDLPTQALAILSPGELLALGWNMLSHPLIHIQDYSGMFETYIDILKPSPKKHPSDLKFCLILNSHHFWNPPSSRTTVFHPMCGYHRWVASLNGARCKGLEHRWSRRKILCFTTEIFGSGDFPTKRLGYRVDTVTL